MHVTWTFTGDGLLAFAGGALALFGVWWSNRQSVRNLQEQLDAEKRASKEEQERRARAVALAILFEIDGFYRMHLRETHGILKDWNPKTDALLSAKSMSVSSQPFPVYYGNSGSLGSLEDGLVFSIVNFYSAAAIFLETLNDYKAESGRTGYGAGRGVFTADEVGRVSDARLAEARARTFGEQLKKASPRLIRIACGAVEKLCGRTGVEFQAPAIAIAAERACAEEAAAEQQVNHAQTN